MRPSLLLLTVLLITGCSAPTVTVGGPPVPTAGPSREELLAIGVAWGEQQDKMDPDKVATFVTAAKTDPALWDDAAATFESRPRQLDEVIDQARATLTPEPPASAGEPLPVELVWVVLRGRRASLVSSKSVRDNWFCMMNVPGLGEIWEEEPFAVADDSGTVFTRSDSTIGGTTPMRNGQEFVLAKANTPDNFRELWASDDGKYECRFQMSTGQWPASASYAIVLGDEAVGPFRFTAEEAAASMNANDGKLILTFDVSQAGE